jgi:hypothetical protein
MNLAIDFSDLDDEDDEEEDLILFFSSIIHYNSMRNSTYLTSEAIIPQEYSPWTFLFRNGDDRSFYLCVVSIVTHLEY